jgi:hypothetical protein
VIENYALQSLKVNLGKAGVDHQFI